jgi:negative regulator of sigma-B (phosphoserine phosphatase)
MSGEIAEQNELIQWSAATLPMPGQSVSGDLHLVKAFPGGVLLAAIDGLGHGEEAAAAAQAAADILERNAQEPPILLVRRCHEMLTRTRGVVMTVAVLRSLDNIMTWIGVGNVEGRLFRMDADRADGHPVESVLLRSGTVGYQLPALQASVISVARGDLLILATDGVQTGFDAGVNAQETPGQIAEKILSRHTKNNDDALVLVARYLGTSHA